MIDWYFKKDGLDWILYINGKSKATLDEIIEKEVRDLPDNIYEFALEMHTEIEEYVQEWYRENGKRYG